jgi:hypothetical protein
MKAAELVSTDGVVRTTSFVDKFDANNRYCGHFIRMGKPKRSKT